MTYTTTAVKRPLFQENLGKPDNEAKEKMGFWEAVASAGPYANNLHLTPDR